MQKLFSAIYELLTDELIIVSVFFVAFCLKIKFFADIVRQGRHTKRPHAAWYIVAVILFGGIIHDFTWVIFTFQALTPVLSNEFIMFVIRIAWIINSLNYAAVALLITSLKEHRNFITRVRHLPLLAPYVAFSLLFVYFAVIYHVLPPTEYERWWRKLSMIFNQVPLTLTVIITLIQMSQRQIPKIIRKQIYTLFLFYLCPTIFFDLSQSILAFGFGFTSDHWVIKLTSVSSAFLLTVSIYYTLNKMLSLRFLNFQPQVNATDGTNFFENLKLTLEHLGRMASFEDIAHRTQQFFSESFAITPDKTQLYQRTIGTPLPSQSITENAVETFLNNTVHQEPLRNFVKQHKILVYDEISCSNFYHEEQTLKAVIAFMDEINADVFLPIQDKKTTVAYLIIERNSRGQQLWTNVERDQMLMYANYLGNILYLLQNKNFEALVQRERALKEELYQKHQEIGQYRESIRVFMRNAKERKIGILFYKNKHYVFGNQAAQELLNFDLNKSDGHPLTQALKRMTQQAVIYKNPQHCIAVDTNNTKLALSAIPGTDGQEIIILIHNPEIGDMIREQIEQLPEPSDWDHVLSLQTTNTGELISQLLPGSGPAVMQTKIAILKASMNTNAVVIDADAEDAHAIAQLLAHITQCKQFQVIEPGNVIQHLERLNERSMLFIPHAHALDTETQAKLADFIHTGTSDARIVLSRQEPVINALMAEVKNRITVPSLVSLARAEYLELVTGLANQLLTEPLYKNILTLSEKEKEQLVTNRPENIQALKKRIQALLLQKAKKNDVAEDVTFDSAYLITDPELAQAARLGKHALKDQRLMTMLWNKFKNPTHIAMFLGVNRTSVYRRCKTYNLS